MNIYQKILFLVILSFVIISGCSSSENLDTKELQSLSDNFMYKNTAQYNFIKDTVNWIGFWKGEGKREELLKEVKDEFSFLNQNIFVNMRFEKDINEINKINTVYYMQTPKYIAQMIKTNNFKWDIIPLIGDSYFYVGQELNDPDWGHKYLVDFKKVPGFTKTQKTFILANPKYREKTGRMVIGPYIEGYYYALFYNDSLAEKIGLSIKDFGMTFNDLLTYVSKINEYNIKNKTNIAPFYDAGDWITITPLFNYLCLSEIGFSKNYRIPETFTNKNKRAFLKTLKDFEILSKYNPIIKSARQNKWNDTKNLILDDKAVFYVNGTWMFNNWEVIDSKKVYKMIPSELPVYKQTGTYLGSYAPNFAVFKKSGHRDNAVKLLMQWTNKDVVEDWIRYAKSPSGTYGYTNTLGFGGDTFERFVHIISKKYGRNIAAAEDNMKYIFGKKSKIRSIYLGRQLQAILFREKSAEKVFQDILASYVEADQ